jgi:hypothetical protein
MHHATASTASKHEGNRPLDEKIAMTSATANSELPVKSRRRWLKRWCFAIALLATLWLTVSYGVVYRFTRRARPMLAEPAPMASFAPVESLRLTTADAEQIGGWFIAGQSDCPIVLLLHGNGASRAACLRQAEIATADGCGAMLISLRAATSTTSAMALGTMSSRPSSGSGITTAIGRSSFGGNRSAQRPHYSPPKSSASVFQDTSWNAHSAIWTLPCGIA